MRPAVRRTTGLLAALVLLAVAAPHAIGAQTIHVPTRVLPEFTTVDLDADTAYWTDERHRHARGRVLARALDTRRIETLFTAARGERVATVAAAGGVVAFETYVERTGVSTVRVAERGTGVWTSRVIAAEASDPLDGTCGRDLSLSGVSGGGSVILVRVRYTGTTGCTLVQEHKRSQIVARDGTVTELPEQHAGWSTSREDSLYEVMRIDDDWATLASGFDSDEFTTKRTHLPTGAEHAVPFGIWPISLGPAGRMIAAAGYSDEKPVLFTSAGDYASYVVLGDGSRRTDRMFEFCGAQIIELRKRRSERRWNIYVRDLDGNITRRLGKAPRNGDFVDCDARHALFEDRVPRRRVVLQTAIPLGG